VGNWDSQRKRQTFIKTFLSLLMVMSWPTASSLLIHTRAWSATFSTIASETSRLGRGGRGLQRNQKTRSDYHSEWTTCSLVTMEVQCTLLITKYHAKSQKSKYQLEALQNEDQTNSGEWGNLITLLKIQMQLTSIKLTYHTQWLSATSCRSRIWTMTNIKRQK